MPIGRDTNSHGQRMLTRVLLGVAFAAVSALLPADADADPGNDFLRALDGYGINLTALLGVSPQAAAELGQAICDDLHLGKSAGTVANELYMKLPRITDKQSGNLVSAAQYTLCPDTFS
jgi:hypothetical protein